MSAWLEFMFGFWIVTPAVLIAVAFVAGVIVEIRKHWK